VEPLLRGVWEGERRLRVLLLLLPRRLNKRPLRKPRKSLTKSLKEKVAEGTARGETLVGEEVQGPVTTSEIEKKKPQRKSADPRVGQGGGGQEETAHLSSERSETPEGNVREREALLGSQKKKQILG